MPDAFNLVDVVAKLKKDLKRANEKAKQSNDDLLFNVKEVEIELKTVIEDNEEAEWGFDFKILKHNRKYNDGENQSHSIKLKLTPFNHPNLDQVTLQSEGNDGVTPAHYPLPSDSNTQEANSTYLINAQVNKQEPEPTPETKIKGRVKKQKPKPDPSSET